MLNRRRLIAISAAAAGCLALPSSLRAGIPEAVTWRGRALGAAATIELYHPDRGTAERLAHEAAAEVTRLERIFSLYTADSALARLNRDGALSPAPPELVELLSACQHFHDLTGGAFDPSVQPLWALYRAHFARPGADPAGPTRDDIARARAKVGFEAVVIGPDRIVLSRRGMALTLNGIAQGYITDRVVEILRRGGMEHSLVDLGEARTIKARPDGSPWRVGIADPDDPARVIETLEVMDRAVATSGSYGFTFDDQGVFHHLFDPRTGLCPSTYRSVTVISPAATEADALSTALSVSAPAHARDLMAALGRDRRAVLFTRSGERLELVGES